MSMLEILVILLVALLVIKPDRLPELSYMLGRLIGKAQRWYQETLQKLNTPM